MSNKYQSNIQTYTARNIIWNSLAAVVDQFPMDAPNPVTLNGGTPLLLPGDFVFQFFRVNWPALTGWPGVVSWNHASNMNVRRVGLYSNFSDGLVMSNIDSRLAIGVCSSVFIITEFDGTIEFTKGSNYVTGTGLDEAFIPGPGFGGFVADDKTAFYPYALYDVNETGTAARLSDFAYRDKSCAKLYRMYYSKLYHEQFIIAALNNMYDAELFFNTSITDVTAAQYPLLFTTAGIIPSSDTFDLRTVTIDTNYNSTPACRSVVSFDAQIEVEITPA